MCRTLGRQRRLRPGLASRTSPSQGALRGGEPERPSPVLPHGAAKQLRPVSRSATQFLALARLQSATVSEPLPRPRMLRSNTMSRARRQQARPLPPMPVWRRTRLVP